MLPYGFPEIHDSIQRVCVSPFQTAGHEEDDRDDDDVIDKTQLNSARDYNQLAETNA